MRQLFTELRSVEEQQREFERELTQLERDLGEKTNKRRAADDMIRRVNEQKANRVKVFGTQMPEIIALINKNKDRFSVAPVGPLGLRMSLKDNAWATAIESATAASLVRSILDHNDDTDNYASNVLLSITTKTSDCCEICCENQIFSKLISL